jgi:Ankyrin repeat
MGCGASTTGRKRVRPPPSTTKKISSQPKKLNRVEDETFSVARPALINVEINGNDPKILLHKIFAEPPTICPEADDNATIKDNIENVISRPGADIECVLNRTESMILTKALQSTKTRRNTRLFPYMTPLMQAILQENLEGVDLLLNHGADVNASLCCDVFCREKTQQVLYAGTTALMLALYQLLEIFDDIVDGKKSLASSMSSWSNTCDICCALLDHKSIDVQKGFVSAIGNHESAFSIARFRLLALSRVPKALESVAGSFERILQRVTDHPSYYNNDLRRPLHLGSATASKESLFREVALSRENLNNEIRPADLVN